MIRIGIIFLIISAIALLLFHRAVHPPLGIAHPATDLQSWHWQQHNGASAGLSVDGDALKANIVNATGDDYDLELFQGVVSLKQGHKYRLTFSAKSSNERSIVISCGDIFNQDRKGMGLNNVVELHPDWQSYEYVFTADHVDGRTDKFPWYLLGKTTGAVWFKDIMVTEVQD
jgi:hypothetical protein